MPQISGLHYGLQCFEGLKAYRDDKNVVRMFRPDMNAKRMQSSAARLAFPSFDEKEWVECVKEVVRGCKTWVPQQAGHSLYLRPTLIGNNQNLQVGPADTVKFFVIASPVGPYYKTGFKPVKLVAERVARRSWPGGTGAFKLGSNYAGPIVHQVRHAKEGYQQILWLAPDDTMDEVGAMNFAMLWKNEQGERELITAPLDGTILPGVTRDSILTLAREWNEFKVTEGRCTIQRVQRALDEGRVEEMFGCGTAAIITAVDGLKVDDKVYAVPCPENSIAKRFMKAILDIQTGVKPHPWSVVVE
jgi:branched-chain amino acid aminotransferase